MRGGRLIRRRGVISFHLSRQLLWTSQSPVPSSRGHQRPSQRATATFTSLRPYSDGTGPRHRLDANHHIHCIQLRWNCSDSTGVKFPSVCGIIASPGEDTLSVTHFKVVFFANDLFQDSFRNFLTLRFPVSGLLFALPQHRLSHGSQPSPSGIGCCAWMAGGPHSLKLVFHVVMFLRPFSELSVGVARDVSFTLGVQWNDILLVTPSMDVDWMAYVLVSFRRFLLASCLSPILASLRVHGRGVHCQRCVSVLTGIGRISTRVVLLAGLLFFLELRTVLDGAYICGAADSCSVSVHVSYVSRRWSCGAH